MLQKRKYTTRGMQVGSIILKNTNLKVLAQKSSSMRKVSTRPYYTVLQKGDLTSSVYLLQPHNRRRSPGEECLWAGGLSILNAGFT